MARSGCQSCETIFGDVSTKSVSVWRAHASRRRLWNLLHTWHLEVDRDQQRSAPVPHADVPISAFGCCPGHPSRMTKRPYAGIGPSKPCVAGVYPACGKTQRCFRLPADIPYGSARSGEIGGRFEDRRASNGSRRQPSIDVLYSRIRSSCAFVKRLSPGRRSTAAG